MINNRPPDFYVLTESGHRSPCFLSGTYPDDPSLLVADQGKTGVFLIDHRQLCLATFSGTRLDIKIEPHDPPTGAWKALTQPQDEPIDLRYGRNQ